MGVPLPLPVPCRPAHGEPKAVAMKRGTVILLIVLVVVGACSGGELSEAPPWGLDGVDMPDTEAQVAAVFAALPEEIVGRTRLGDEPTHFGYIDEGSGSFWTIQADPWELQQALHMPGVDSPADWVTFLASGRSAVLVERAPLIPLEISCGWQPTSPRKNICSISGGQHRMVLGCSLWRAIRSDDKLWSRRSSPPPVSSGRRGNARRRT